MFELLFSCSLGELHTTGLCNRNSIDIDLKNDKNVFPLDVSCIHWIVALATFSAQFPLVLKTVVRQVLRECDLPYISVVKKICKLR
jgi:hypothetical protein